MTFLQPLILWGLPLLFIPVIIHLLNRLRHRPQPWAAMRFLRAANQSSISQARLKQFLILLFRVLAVAALIFFLSRPLAGGWLGWALSPAPEAIVLILDRSASMETAAGATGKTRREQALELWTDALRSFGASSRVVLLDSATQAPQELPSLGALALPQFTGPTDTQADIPALIQRAYNYLKESRSGAAEIWIASDLQESNWRPRDPQWERVMAQFEALPQKIRFRLLSFEPVDNTSVALVEAVRRRRGDNHRLNLVLDLQRTSISAQPVVLKWNLGGGSSQAELNLEGQSLRWRNSFPLSEASESGWGKVETGADANLADNTLYFAYGQEQSPEALIVSTASGPAVRPLQLAASDLSRPTGEWARVVTPELFAGAPLTNTALIVWQAGALPGAAPDILQQFVSSGGSLLFLPAAGETPSFAGLNFGEVIAAPTNSVLKVTKWNELEGPLSRTEEGFGVPLNTLEVHRRAAIAGTGGVLGSFSDGAPFLVRKPLGRGEVYFCATSADPGWSTLADGAVLVPMLQRLVSMGAKRVNTAVMTDCGALANRPVEDWTRVDQPGTDSPRWQAGVYRVDGRFVAVNRPVEENDLMRVAPGAARQLFGNVPFRMHEERNQGSDRLQGEIWRVFVTLMLIFLIIEGILILPARTESKAPATTRTRKHPQEVAA